MPGLFGAIGVPPEILDRLETEVSRRWPTAAFARSSDTLLGAHAHGDATSMLRLPDGVCLALDGEWSLYREVHPRDAESLARARRLQGAYLDPDLQSSGNVALLDPERRTLHLVVDSTGTFPLYFARLGAGLVFGSLLRPLALLTEAGRDDVAIIEFLRQAYTVGGKTVYQGIRRLLPGQSLTFEVGGSPRLYERSDAWTDLDARSEPRSVASETWNRLLASLDRSIPDSHSALMMSGGWDSRTLLAGIQELDKGVHCYSHGDIESRELAIVRRLCAAADTPCTLETIDDRVLDPGLLYEGFLHTENVVFPHWHRAGKLLAAEGVEAISAGVFGEILGGHYGPAMLQGPLGKIASIGSSLLGVSSLDSRGTRRSARDFLRLGELGHHWYLDPEWEGDARDIRDRMNADIDSAAARLEARGVTDDVTLVEAFISEHRGTQYINAQLLSCRAHTDIALPFAGGEIFSFSTQTSLAAKIHNRLNRQILRAHARHLLRAPMAATLLPASWPLILQEASRVSRKAYEHARMIVHQQSQGRVARPRLGWVNFDFLASGSALRAIAGDLRCEFWDHEAIRAEIERIARSPNPSIFHPMFDQMSKIYTIDLTLRAPKD